MSRGDGRRRGAVAGHCDVAARLGCDCYGLVCARVDVTGRTAGGDQLQSSRCLCVSVLYADDRKARCVRLSLSRGSLR